MFMNMQFSYAIKATNKQMCSLDKQSFQGQPGLTASLLGPLYTFSTIKW